ncbi:DNA-processing protein DprA [Campylobacter sp. 7477a]|uniref:DNA-processing protein DprA n=1 Tax=Campylobacter sp. 7477a TaxID=2735741 RepID=UPI003014F036|nr:DNA-protecting protein DprA [Campylobacter sp. 7477a]
MKILAKDKFISKLDRLTNPPKELYYEGDIDLLIMPKVAVVGSRKASVYTKECVARLCTSLKNHNVCVVSGGALGVDIAAHKAAMPLTIGVFATGLDTFYPSSNAKFIKEIYDKGLALSEYSPGSPAIGYKFLERNRIVVALSQALVVAQADLKSGSMQSARLAGELGVPVFVLPQRMGESEGTNMLLAKGKAKLINDFDEFSSQFGLCLNKTPARNDDILEFCKDFVSLEKALAKFGDKIYEYELEGLVEIINLKVKSKI